MQFSCRVSLFASSPLQSRDDEHRVHLQFGFCRLPFWAAIPELTVHPAGNGWGTSVERVRNFAGDGAPKELSGKRLKSYVPGIWVESPVSLHEQRVASGVHWTA